MINDHERDANNRKANHLLYLFLIIGVMPLLCIFVLYYKNPDYSLLNKIAISTENLPGITSSYNSVMTKVMDVYCKTAPFLALILFSLTFKIRTLIKNFNRHVLIRACLLTPFFYAATIYLFLFRSLELTTAGRPVRFMSTNDLTLLLFYISLYSVILLITYGTLFTPVIAFKLLKERQ